MQMTEGGREGGGGRGREERGGEERGGAGQGQSSIGSKVDMYITITLFQTLLTGHHCDMYPHYTVSTSAVNAAVGGACPAL